MARTLAGLWVCLAMAHVAVAQTVPGADPIQVPAAASPARPAAGAALADGNWRAPAGASSGAAAARLTSSDASLDAQRVQPASPAVPVRSGGKDMLPNDQGQIWQQYDISVYTSHVKDVEHPEQAIMDWILRETGTEVWFRPPLGLLNINATTLSVYHTPEMQQIVADVVGRFVNGTQDQHVLSLRVAAVDNPGWRSTFLSRLRPVAVQSPGIEAWLLSKEDAALLLSELRRRSDFREHSAPNLVYFNGQSQNIANLRPRVYVRSYQTRMQDNMWMGYDIERGQIQEGFSMQVSPLLSQDERTLDVVLKCNVDQVEKLVPVSIDLPGPTGQVQRADIQVPQLVSWRLHERFRWSANQVLLLSCGVVASPGPDRQSSLGIPNLFGRGGSRADALLFVESLGKASQALITGSTTTVGSAAVQTGARY